MPFEDLYAASEVIEVEGTAVRVASVQDLIAMKEAVGRPRDLQDVLELRRIQRERDRPIAITWRLRHNLPIEVYRAASLTA